MTGLEREIERANQRRKRLIPTSFENARLQLRASTATDADVTFEVVMASAEQLGPWTPWTCAALVREGIARHLGSAEEKWRAREMLEASADE